MAKDRLSGKLAVILHADVAGSTELVKQNEHVAHERIQDAFRRFGDTIKKYRGRVRELRGDALLAEFERATNAVSAALAFQVDQVDHNAQLSDDIRPTLRIGVALGEVVIADNTVTGEGVVLAQRVEQLAERGGLCITGAVQEALPGRMPFTPGNLGEQTLKGFDEPVRVYAVRLKEGESIPPPEDSGQASVGWKPAVAVSLIIAVIALVWFRPWEIGTGVEAPDMPSIAVLPFNNMSADPEQEYFADGMTEDLITDLSKLSGLIVISRNSSFTYKGKSMKVSQVAKELGVRYVLEGSVRRAGDHVRINAQLIDGLSDRHLWAEIYDGSFDDIFVTQDEIRKKIITELQVNLTAEDRSRQDQRETTSIQAHDAFLRGWNLFLLFTPQDSVKALQFFKEAVELDSNYGRAHAAIAEVYWRSWNNGWWERMGLGSVDLVEKWEYHLEQAIKNPTPLAHQVQSKVYTDQHRWDDALASAERALALNQGNARSHETMARILFKVGRAEEALEFINQAIGLDPKANYTYFLGTIQFHAKRFEESATTLIRTTKRNPDNEWGFIRLASALGHLGRLEEAKSAIDTFNEFQARAGKGDYTLGHIGEWFFKKEVDRELVAEGLRKAGLPEGNISVPREKPDNIDGATTIDAVEAKALHDRGVRFVDVRDRVWWEKNRIPGAIHLEAFNDFSEASLSKVVGKNEDVVIYCSKLCKRGAGACASAVSWGFTKVYYFRDGGVAWEEAGYTMDGSG